MFTDQLHPRVNLEVKNFGPIAGATIDLRPLTVFVGPSNTGKSYLAILIYSLHNVLQTQSGLLFRHRRRWPVDDELGFPSADRATRAASGLSSESAVDLDRWIDEELFSKPRSRSRTVSVASSPKELQTAICDVLTGEQPQYAKSVERIVTRSFGLGADLSPLVRHGSGNPAQVLLRTTFGSHTDSDDSFVHELQFGKRKARYETQIAKDSLDSVSTRNLGRLRPFMLDRPPISELDERDRITWLSNTIQSLSELALRELSGPLSKPAYYLPADRTGVMHAHNVVVGALLDSAPYAGIRERPTNAVMTGVLADFLREMMEIGDNDIRINRGETETVAGLIEEGVLQGAVASDRTEAGHPAFSYVPKGWTTNVPLSRTSSMVSELAPVVLYLRHLVGPGDTLIIEEPESHLHPAAQAEFATILSRLVKYGVRVIVTTHSNWIVDQFANLVRMGDLDPAHRADLIGQDATLPKEEVGVWLFEEGVNQEGSTVTEIDFDVTGVGYEPGYLGVADMQYNTWAEINDRLADAARRV